MYVRSTILRTANVGQKVVFQDLGPSLGKNLDLLNNSIQVLSGGIDAITPWVKNYEIWFEEEGQRVRVNFSMIEELL